AESIPLQRAHLVRIEVQLVRDVLERQLARAPRRGEPDTGERLLRRAAGAAHGLVVNHAALLAPRAARCPAGTEAWDDGREARLNPTAARAAPGPNSGTRARAGSRSRCGRGRRRATFRSARRDTALPGSLCWWRGSAGGTPAPAGTPASCTSG